MNITPAHTRILIANFIKTVEADKGITVYAKMGRKWFYANPRSPWAGVAVREYRGSKVLAYYYDELGNVVVLSNDNHILNLSEKEFKKL